MNAARYLVDSLRRHGVDTVFGYPGGAIMPVYDALAEEGPTHILCRHEQAAAFAANGYARASGRLGVCLATSGPGATNLITALADAQMDSVPLLAITGQVPTALMGSDAFQETDVLGLSLAVTKHSYLVRSAAELPEILDQAVELAQSGRPGPVLVDIPKDVQLAPLTAAPACAPRAAPRPEAPDAAALEEARRLIRQSRRPVICAGGGIALGDAVEVFREFVQATGIPTVTTLKGIGALAHDHPLNLGMLGMHGAPCANLRVQESDLLIVVGARFDDRATGRLEAFAPGAAVIHLDIDPAEVGKLRPPTVSLVGGLAAALAGLMVRPDIGPWRERCARSREREGHPLPPPGPGISPQRFLRALSQAADGRTYISCDVGQHQMWVAQYYGFRHPRLHLTSGGLGAMGFGLPAAIGAQLADPGARVINVTGDGSFMINPQELATLRRYDLPVKIVLFDNQYLGMVRQQQELFYAGRYSAVDLSDNPDFVALARAFGIPALRATEASELEAAVEACLQTEGPLLLHLPIAREDNVWPIVGAGRANHEMIRESLS